MEQRWASVETGSAAVCGLRNNYERRNVQLQSTAAQTTLPLNWCTREKLCQDGTRTSRFCGMKLWTSKSPRKGETGGSTECVSSSALVESGTSPGPPLTRGAMANEAKKFAQFLRDLGRDFCWSILCVQEFTASDGDVVTETAAGHRVFATPLCKGQRRLSWSQLRPHHFRLVALFL